MFKNVPEPYSMIEDKKRSLLAIVSYITTILCRRLPSRSVIPFLRLLLGSLASGGGHVTAAIVSLRHDVTWSSHYKWLCRGGTWCWRHLALGAVEVLSELTRELKTTPQFFVIDDTLVERVSRKAPGTKIHFDHSKKPNRSSYINGQCLVSLSAAVRTQDKVVSLPLLHLLAKGTGNEGKLEKAKELVSDISPLVNELPRYLLVDAWYMRETLIKHAREKGFHVIGQVRIDTDIRHIPPTPLRAKRGRPRIYGNKISPKSLAHTRFREATLPLYGKNQQILFHSTVAYARFLGPVPVRAVWVHFVTTNPKTGEKTVGNRKLFLSTDTSLDPLQCIQHYEMRWIHIPSLAEFIPAFLLAFSPHLAELLARRTPWRKDRKITSRIITEALKEYFQSLSIHDIWSRTQKFCSFPIRELNPHTNNTNIAA